MKMRFATCLCAAAVVIGCSRANVEQASQEFNRLPPAVQQTVRSQAPQAEIADIRRFNRQDRDIFRIEFRDAQRYPPMEIAADGMIVKYEAGTEALGRPMPNVDVQRGSGAKENELSALPTGVQEAIRENAPKAQVESIRRSEENGRVVYDVEYVGNQPRPVLRVTADGTVLKKPMEPARPQPRSKP
jgi:hypothetical protein